MVPCRWQCYQQLRNPFFLRLEGLFHGQLQYTPNPKFMCNGLISQYRQMYLEWGGAHNRFEHLGNMYGNCESVGKSTGRKETIKRQIISTKWWSRCVIHQCGASRMFSVPIDPWQQQHYFPSKCHEPLTVSHSRRCESQQHSCGNLISLIGLPCCIYLTVSFPGQSEELSYSDSQCTQFISPTKCTVLIIHKY